MIYIASHPTRFKILSILNDEKGYASSIGEKLGMERKITAFHLNTLEKHGLVKSEFGLTENKRPSAVKYYEITDLGREILKKIKKIL